MRHGFARPLTIWKHLPPRPTVSYLICASPRSGSTLLGDLLARTGLAGKPDEHFLQEANLAAEWGTNGFTEYYQSVLWVGTSANGVFGTKVMSGMMAELCMKLRAVYGLPGAMDADILEAAFPNLHYIWLSRRDKLRQAISFYRASQTGAWVDASGPTLELPWTLAFNFREIETLMPFTYFRDANWQTFFEERAIRPLRIFYEDVVRQPAAILGEILDFLRVDIPQGVTLPEPRLRRQADHLSASWEHQYHQQCAEGWTPQ